MNESSFIEIFKSNNNEKNMKNFLLMYGKKPKPISPVIFDVPVLKGEDDGSRNHKHE